MHSITTCCLGKCCLDVAAPTSSIRSQRLTPASYDSLMVLGTPGEARWSGNTSSHTRALSYLCTTPLMKSVSRRFSCNEATCRSECVCVSGWFIARFSWVLGGITSEVSLFMASINETLRRIIFLDNLTSVCRKKCDHSAENL